MAGSWRGWAEVIRKAAQYFDAYITRLPAVRSKLFLE